MTRPDSKQGVRGGLPDQFPLLPPLHPGPEEDPEPEEPGRLAPAQHHSQTHLCQVETERGILGEPPGGGDHLRLAGQLQRALRRVLHGGKGVPQGAQ